MIKTLTRAVRRLKQKDYQDEAYWLHTFENVSLLREVIFTTIEGVVVIGALQAAFSRHQSFMLLALLVFAWITLSAYLFILGRYVLNAANRKYGLIANRHVFAWIAGILPIFLSLAITYSLSAAVAELISINFMSAIASS